MSLALRLIGIGPALILLLLVVIMTLASPFFMTGDNLKNVLVQVAPLACLAIGQLFVILVGGIDLSVGSVLALCTVTGALAYGWGDLGAGPDRAGDPPHRRRGRRAQRDHAREGPDAARLHPDARDAERRARASRCCSPTAPRCPGMPKIVTTAGAGELGPIPVPVLIVAGFAGLAWLLATRMQWGRWIYLVAATRRRRGASASRSTAS